MNSNVKTNNILSQGESHWEKLRETHGIGKSDFLERRCKRCGRMLKVWLNLIPNKKFNHDGDEIKNTQRIELFEEIRCPKCGYFNFFRDIYGE